ncbi:hypothetical protein P7H22_11810 [Paenibacillus larvae]|nr:hypothetical protein [Paenibacillus larvae]MDT2240902.1 hypothetical protein [Paenibacillus larvae]
MHLQAAHTLNMVSFVASFVLSIPQNLLPNHVEKSQEPPFQPDASPSHGRFHFSNTLSQLSPLNERDHPQKIRVSIPLRTQAFHDENMTLIALQNRQFSVSVLFRWRNFDYYLESISRC